MQRREVSRNGGNFFVLRFCVDAKYKSIMIGDPPPPHAPPSPKKPCYVTRLNFMGFPMPF